MASLRHLAEVIRTHRLAPGVSVDKDIVGGVSAGDRNHLRDSAVVIAVARAAHLIAGVPFDDAERLAVACARVNMLEAVARERDERPPALVPAPRPDSVVLETYVARPPGRRRRWIWWVLGGVAVVAVSGGAVAVSRSGAAGAEATCRDGAVGQEIIDDSTDLFADDDATRLNPTLDFDQMNGSARYASHGGLTYYWGRAGSDDATAAAGGARVRWQTPGGRWHTCPVALPVDERGYVHTPAVATTIGGRPVAVQVCLWRDTPRRENCTPVITTG